MITYNFVIANIGMHQIFEASKPLLRQVTFGAQMCAKLLVVLINFCKVIPILGFEIKAPHI